MWRKRRNVSSINVGGKEREKSKCRAKKDKKEKKPEERPEKRQK